MKKLLVAGLIAMPTAGGMGYRCAAANVVFQDDMNRATFDASHNGWVVQSYAKGKGSFGLVPAAVNSNTDFRYSVNINGSGTAIQSNTVTSTVFALPAAGQYLEFSANLNIDPASAATPGLVFAVSAFGQDASSNEWATNFEFLTKQLNVGNQSTAYDRLSLTSFNNFSAANPNNEWSANVESGVNATVGFHTYTMRIFTGEVDYLVDNTVIATTTSNVPTGHGLSFELNAWAPDSSWASAEAPLPNNSSYHMDAAWAKVLYGTVGTPVWTGTLTSDPVVLKEAANWTNGSPGTGNEAVIDDSSTVLPTLYFGNAGTIGVAQTLGALTINSSVLTALNANTGTAPATPTTYGITFVGNAGNTVPLISLGSNVTQAISISDTANATLNLQLGIAGGSINVSNAGASLTINSAVVNAAGVSAGFNKIGGGSLVLSNTANTFGGVGQTVTITGGVLSVNANGELGDTANTITLNGGTLLVNPAAALTLSRSIITSSGGSTINLPTSSVTFNSPMSGSGLLTKTGAAELVLNSVGGSYNGTIAVNAGNLRLINPGSVSSGTIVQLVGLNSTLNLRADTDSSYPVNVEAVTNPVQIFSAPQTAGNSGHTLSVGTIKLGATTLNIGGNTGYGVQSGAVTLTGNGTVASNTAPLAIASISETGGARSMTKTGSNRLTLNGAGTYTGATNVTVGTFEIAGSGSLSSTSIAVSAGATLAVDPGATLAAASAVTDNGSINLGMNPGSGILTTTLRTLNLGYNGTVAGTLVVGTAASSANRTVLNITGNGSTSGLMFAGTTNAWHGQVDLGGNDLIVKNGSAADIGNQLKSGFNAGAGYWNGSAGIISSAAAGDARFLTTLGYRAGGSTFDDATTSTNDVLVKYTYFGDADLNGVVNGADYQQIDLGFGSGATGWVNGDFNYDGIVNGSDFALIDNTFNQLTATGAVPLANVANPASDVSSISMVPEPTGIFLLSFGAVAGIVGRRRIS